MRFIFALVLVLVWVQPSAQAAGTRTVVFAGGCFWCMQPGFDAMPGVISTEVGYTGGEKATATYTEVSTGKTGHREAIQVVYDPAKVRFDSLVNHYLENIDPTDGEGQFADKGSQYTTAIYYADASEKQVAEQALRAIEQKFKPQPIAVLVLPVKPFYPAELAHQKYYQKNTVHYDAYKRGSGRSSGLKKLWGGEKAN